MKYALDILDVLPEHIAVLDKEGSIVFVNKSWRIFSKENGGPQDGSVGTNYLRTCDNARNLNAQEAEDAASGIRAILEGRDKEFALEYSCHSPEQKRWYYMLVAPTIHDGVPSGAVVSHFDITRRKILEMELKRSEIHFKTIADHAGDWEWWISPRGEFLYVSPTCLEVTGYEAREFIADPTLLDRILHPEDAKRYAPSMTGRVGDSEKHYDEFRIIHKDGNTVWIGHLCKPVFGTEGTWLGRRASNRDISIQKGLEEDLRRYEGIVASTPNMISLVDSNLVYRMVNDTYVRTFSTTKEHIIGKHVSEVLGEITFETVVRDRLIKCLNGETITYEAFFEFPGTGRTCLEVTYYPYRPTPEAIQGVVVSARDVTDRKMAEEALKRSEERLNEAQQISQTGDFSRDLITGRGFWSKEFFRLLDYPDRTVPSLEAMVSRMHAEDREIFLVTVDQSLDQGGVHDLDFRVVLRSGTIRYLSGKIDVDLDEYKEPIYYHGTLTDVTALKEAEAKLVEMATTDPLTGILNRRRFLELAGRELSLAVRHGNPLSLLMMDVDHFKSINDNHGHDAGDEVLMSLVRLTSEVLRDSDVFGRLGGEEFAILLPQTSGTAAEQAAEKIRVHVMDSTIRHNDKNIQITVSIGISNITKDVNSVEALMKDADEALYGAKDSGRNRISKKI